MSFELAATILGAVLAVLFVTYARNKKRPSKSNPRSLAPASHKPDLISKTAGGIYRTHRFLNKVFAIAIIGAVLYGAVVDSMMRIIVLSTIGVMALIAAIWLIGLKRKNRKPKLPDHVQIIE